MLAGCGGSPLAISATATMQNAETHPGHGRSWMARNAKSGDLLYVSDQGPMNVYVFSYPRGMLVGTLTGFNEPAGECSDKSGNVYIVNAFGQDILEYAHGGTSPIRTAYETGWFPSGCSVDPTTGNLAVTTYCSGISPGCTGSGTIFIYTAKGRKRTGSGLSNYYFCGYDNKGNLFWDGVNASGFAFAELPAGASKSTNITLNQSIGHPGNVQWDGTYVAVGDSSTNKIYQFSISGTHGTKVGATRLGGATFVGQFWIQGAQVVGPNDVGSNVGNVKFWNYPAGGSSIKTIMGLKKPEGVTVSVAQ